MLGRRRARPFWRVSELCADGKWRTTCYFAGKRAADAVRGIEAQHRRAIAWHIDVGMPDEVRQSRNARSKETK